MGRYVCPAASIYRTRAPACYSERRSCAGARSDSVSSVRNDDISVGITSQALTFIHFCLIIGRQQQVDLVSRFN